MELETLISFDNVIEAELLRLKLENEGIECFLFDKHLVSTNPMYANALGGIKIKVKNEDVDVAKQIMLLDFQINSSKPFVCELCASNEYYTNFNSFNSLKAIFAIILSILTFSYPIYAIKARKCKSCGKEQKTSN